LVAWVISWIITWNWILEINLTHHDLFLSTSRDLFNAIWPKEEAASGQTGSGGGNSGVVRRPWGAAKF
jgi:hypothetical protein